MVAWEKYRVQHAARKNANSVAVQPPSPLPRTDAGSCCSRDTVGSGSSEGLGQCGAGQAAQRGGPATPSFGRPQAGAWGCPKDIVYLPHAQEACARFTQPTEIVIGRWSSCFIFASKQWSSRKWRARMRGSLLLSMYLSLRTRSHHAVWRTLLAGVD